jgi:unsaturated chondroitin disaccharide hydrolase
LDFAQKITDIYLKRLPKDDVPYWDFDDPMIPDAPKDASAASIVASGLLELSTYLPQQKSAFYRNAALRMLKSLSSKEYQSGRQNHSFLLHSTGNKPAGYEIDASIIYADYYYIEALTRLKKIESLK